MLVFIGVRCFRKDSEYYFWRTKRKWYSERWKLVSKPVTPVRLCLCCQGVRGLLPNLHEEAVPQFYVMGGCLATTELASAQHYNPETNSWKLLPPMPTERRWCAGAALKGWLYVIGGQQEGHILPTAERFDVETGRWEALPDMPTCREACAVASCASYLYVLGGCQHDVPLSVAERLHVEDCWGNFPS